VATADEVSAGREPDDAVARQPGAVSEDAQPVTTDADAEKSAQGSAEDPAGHRRDKADDMRTE